MLGPISTRAVHSPSTFLLPPTFPAPPLHRFISLQPLHRFSRCERPPPVHPLLTDHQSRFPVMIPAPFHPNVLATIPLSHRHCTASLRSPHPRNRRRRGQGGIWDPRAQYPIVEAYDWFPRSHPLRVSLRPLAQAHPGQSPSTRGRYPTLWPLTTAVRSSWWSLNHRFAV